MNSDRSETLSSVERALALMEILGREEGLSLTQLSERLQSGKTTVFRLTTTLVERGWLIKDEDLRYSLGPAALALGAAHHDTLDLKKLLLPIMIELNEETAETIHLTRLEGRYIVYVHQLLSPKPVVSLATLGSRSPAHCVSPGLAQLAALSEAKVDWALNTTFIQYTDKSPANADAVRHELENVRKRGFGINQGSFRPDVGGVGVAIKNEKGEPIAGLSICVPVFRLAKLNTDELGKRLLRAAQDAEIIIRNLTKTPQSFEKSNHVN